MQFPRKLAIPLVLVVLASMLAWLTWVNQTRLKRIEYVSGLAGGSELRADPDSPTGYENGLRIMIFPDAIEESYQWILQTEQMMTTGPWRLRRVDYDNAPQGREVVSTSPYRWWLALTAKVDHLWSDQPISRAVERASVVAGPILHLLILFSTGFYVTRRASVLAGILATLLLGAAFPLSETMLGGRPTSEHLSLLFALWSVLPLVAPSRSQPGRDSDQGPTRANGFAFILAGGVGALGLWTDFSLQAPVLIGVAIGGLAVSLCPLLGLPVVGCRPSDWRRWGLAGGVVSILAYLIEFFPGHLAWLDLQGNHPVYAIVWAGVGELLYRVSARVGDRPATAGENRIMTGVVALGLVLAPALMILNSSQGFLPFNAVGSNLPGTLLNSDLHPWTAHHGAGMVTLATLLPVLVLLGSLWFALSGRKNPDGISQTLISWGPVGLTLAMAFFQPVWWPMATVLLIPVLVASMALPVAPRSTRPVGWIWAAITLVAVSPGPWLHYTLARGAADPAVSESEVTALVERNLSHWLARRVGPAGANVLAPPRLTVSLIFHGGLSGLSTPYIGNQEGFAAAVRLAAATSADEAKALAESRKLTHIMIPSWDDTLDDYARLGATEEASTLMGMLHRWLPPRWLSPLAYQMPQVEGFDKDYAAIFGVVEVQDNATALSRLTEYFLEMGQTEAAVSVGQALEYSFPGDLNALTARAEIALARKDAAQFRTVMDQIVALLDGGSGNYLVWDRRISLSVMLAQFSSGLLAREQLEICLEEADEDLVRSLSTVFLFRFLSLMAAFNLEFDDPEIRPMALQLLPEEMRVGL